MTLDWPDMIRRSLGGQGITREEGRLILALPDEQVPEALQAAF